MAQQTAVEYLVNKLNAIIGKTLVDPMVALSVMHEVIKAKQIEKEQIIMAHCHNRCLNDKTYECSIKAFENSEQYYNETFNK